ncbi:MAG: ABC transporter permease [Chloroflexi bacterium]|nr:ABC transporter permease [Chloroflexota bacterium]
MSGRVADVPFEEESDRFHFLRSVGTELRAVLREPRGALAVTVLVVLLFFAFIFPVLDPTDPNNPGDTPKHGGITWDAPMGTDHISRDLLARNSIGLGRTIKHGFIAVFVGWVVGITIGYTAGWRGGRTDTLIMRGVDVLLAFPGIVFAILLITIIGSGIFSVAVAIAFFNIPGSARLARAGVLRERERDYVLAGRCLGLSGRRILFRHVAPNTFGAFTVQVPLAIVASVLIMAALNFLGLGAELPDPTLGAIMQEGRPFMRDAPHFVLGPVLILALMLTALNFLSDVLTERLDPVRRRRV